MLNEVRSILSLDHDRAWRPPIVLTEAVREENVEKLWAEIERHRAHLEESGLLEARRRDNLRGEVFDLAVARAKDHLERSVDGDPGLERLLDEVHRRELDPLTAVSEIVEKVFRIPGATTQSGARLQSGSGVQSLGDHDRTHAR
jgi:LAO/AO transport system kinase